MITWRGWRHHLRQALIAVALCAGCFFAVGLLLLTGFSINSPTSRVERARSDLKNIDTALARYRDMRGRYPTTQEGLQVLVSHQLLEVLPRDPWNGEYHYALTAEVPTVWSAGADGLPGGEGQDADLHSPTSAPP